MRARLRTLVGQQRKKDTSDQRYSEIGKSCFAPKSNEKVIGRLGFRYDPTMPLNSVFNETYH